MILSRSRKRRSSLALLTLFLAAVFIIPSACAAPVLTEIGIPRSAEAGAPINVWVNVTSTEPIHKVWMSVLEPATGDHSHDEMRLESGNVSSGTWVFEIPARNWKGRLECTVMAEDISGSSSRHSTTIEITGDARPKPFPWNMVLMIAFLAAALVVTELIFKPGLYRPTGREKARKLEEEDREREASNEED